MDDAEKLKLLTEALRAIGEVAVTPEVSLMRAVIHIQNIADEALNKTGLNVQRAKPNLRVVE